MTPDFFVSFWDLCLDNLSNGVISNRIIPPSQARSLIAAARSRGTLIGVSAEDLA